MLQATSLLPPRLLRYRAGPAALRTIREEGLRPESIGAFVAPASGPRWLILAGIDRALLDHGWLGTSPQILAGASAGAWRCASFASSRPRETHQQLLNGYISQTFTRADTPRQISAAYRTMLGECFAEEAAHILEHPTFRLVLGTCRSRLGSSRAAQLTGLLVAAALDRLTPRATELFFESVAFHTLDSENPALDPTAVRLSAANLLDAVRASGTVPIYMEPVRNPAGAPAGEYVDGGLTQYHLHRDFRIGPRQVVLFPHYQETIRPRWLDRWTSRSPTPSQIDSLLLIYPSPAFLTRLEPHGVPDRQDFKRWVDDPAARQAHWWRAAAESEALGEELVEDLESGRLAERVEPL